MTLILTRGDVAALLTLDECIAAVEEAFAEQGLGRALGPGVLGLHVPGGGFHVKAAGVYEKAIATGRGLTVDLAS